MQSSRCHPSQEAAGVLQTLSLRLSRAEPLVFASSAGTTPEIQIIFQKVGGFLIFFSPSF